MRVIVAVAICLALASGLAPVKAAAESIRVGKAVPTAWIFTPIDVGVEVGIFKRYGIDVEILSFAGDARLNQAMAADGVDIGLAGGTNIGFALKGVPIKAVAALLNEPAFMGLTVGYDSPIKTAQDVKDKRIGVTNPSSLTYYLVRELSRRQGWGPEGIAIVPLGAPPAIFAAFKAGQVDGFVSSAEAGFAMEPKREGRVLLTYGTLLPDYHSLIIFSTDSMIAKRPKVLKDFLKGWFETIAWMRANKERAIEISNKVTKLPPDVVSKTYDTVMPTFSRDGKFKPAAIRNVIESMIELGVANKGEAIDPKALSTEQFLPSN